MQAFDDDHISVDDLLIILDQGVPHDAHLDTGRTVNGILCSLCHHLRKDMKEGEGGTCTLSRCLLPKVASLADIHAFLKHNTPYCNLVFDMSKLNRFFVETAQDYGFPRSELTFLFEASPRCKTYD